MVDLRLSPSGPVIAAIGAGFISKQWRTSILSDQGQGTIDIQGLGEVGMGPGSPPVATTLAVDVLANMNYSGRLSTMFTAINAGTNSLQVALQYSNNAGVSWNDIARNTLNVPGIIGDVQQSGLFRVTLEPDAVLGSALLPVNTEAGEVLFRGAMLWGGATQLLWTTGTGDGSTNLRVQEELAS